VDLHRRIALDNRRIPLVHLTKVGTKTFPVHSDVLNSTALPAVFNKYGTFLLPMAFPEGCPQHPSYGSGHATVAGACITVLKAVFDDSQVFQNPMVPSDDGLSLLSDGTIYVGSALFNSETGTSRGILYAINPDGTEKWSFTTDFNGAVESSPAIGIDGTVYVGSDDNNLYAINPNGAEKWAFATAIDAYNPVQSSPAIGIDGTVYVGAGDLGNLYAIDANGNGEWVFAGSPDISMPAIGSDGTIYVGSEVMIASNSDIGYLYAINPDGTAKWSFSPEAGSFDNLLYSTPAIASAHALGQT
jgi:outer membrane protein assembly factor BamB